MKPNPKFNDAEHSLQRVVSINQSKTMNDKIYIQRISDGFTGKGNTILRLSTSTITSKQTMTMSVLDLERLKSEIDKYLKNAWS